MNITKATFEQIVSLFYFDHDLVPTQDEMELSYYCPKRPLTREAVMRVMSYFKVPSKFVDTLDVTVRNVRLTFDADPKSLSPDVILDPSAAVMPKPLHCIEKRRKGSAVDVPDYRMRFSRRLETPISFSSISMTEFSHRSRGHYGNFSRMYRLKRRYSLELPDHEQGAPNIRLDLTVVRSLQQDRADQPVPTLGGVLHQPESYEIELEWIGTNRNPTMIAKSLMREFTSVIKVVDQSVHVLALSEQTRRLEEYWTMTNSKKFVGPKPGTLEIHHLLTGGGLRSSPTEDGHDAYSVTDKADGERMLMMVCKDGQVVLLDDRDGVHGTHLKSTDFRSCLLDGERLSSTRFLVFDAYIENGRSIRDRPLLPNRLDTAARVIASLRPSEKSKAKSNVIVQVKEFHPTGDSAMSFAKACARVLSSKKDYDVDGLIFTPIHAPVPEYGGRWLKTLKWKPPEQNTIDFLVRFKSQSQATELAVTDSMDNVCVIADLCVGQSEWIAGGPLSTLSMLSGSAKARLAKTHGRPEASNYIAVPFRHSPIAYLSCEPGSVQPVAANRDQIFDGDVVEFSYDLSKSKSSVAEPHRWRAMRVRYDKVNRKTVTANNYVTADNVWRSIHHALTKEMMIDAAALDKAIAAFERKRKNAIDSDEYYLGGEKALDPSISMKQMRKLHNIIKGDVLLGRFSADKETARSILDLGVGRAGDLAKWIQVGATRVLGIDKFELNITDPDPARSSAHYRILTATNIPKNMHIVCIAADVTQSLLNPLVRSALSEPDIANLLWGEGSSTSVKPKTLQMYHGFAKLPFDLVTCMFAIHYMFESKEDLTQFAQNVKAHLRPGGHFVGCCLDGDAVDALLAKEAPKVGDSVYGKHERLVAWSIKRGYPAKTAKDAFGRRIDVFVASIGQELPEYLVSFSVLKSVLKQEANLELVETAMFQESAKEDAAKLSEYERKYSFLHRWFIFQQKLHPE